MHTHRRSAYRCRLWFLLLFFLFILVVTIWSPSRTTYVVNWYYINGTELKLLKKRVIGLNIWLGGPYNVWSQAVGEEIDWQTSSMNRFRNINGAMTPHWKGENSLRYLQIDLPELSCSKSILRLKTIIDRAPNSSTNKLELPTRSSLSSKMEPTEGVHSLCPPSSSWPWGVTAHARSVQTINYLISKQSALFTNNT